MGYIHGNTRKTSTPPDFGTPLSGLSHTEIMGDSVRAYAESKRDKWAGALAALALEVEKWWRYDGDMMEIWFP